jgi:hypothetical protein
MKQLLAFVIAVLVTPLAVAQTTLLPGKVALHIAEMHYQHPVRMLHPYYDYWHMKGPSAEKASLNAMKKRFAEVAWCNQAQDAEVLVFLEPHLFYNAQLRVFHAEFIASVYNQDTGNANLAPAVFKVKKQAQVHGELTLKPEVAIEKAYTKAMEKVIRALEQNKEFLSSLNVNQTKNAERICPVLDALPVSKLYY